MLSYLAAVGAVWIVKRAMRMGFFAPQVIDNRLNPVHLAIGIRCYQRSWAYPSNTASSRPALPVSRSTKAA
ncbi:hypothetical protein ColLi_00817 [Colletotrichum liriopes]|uniref:Uncharacterized protein n=1 Tax=Colletotrichum liriopes TaxID=708192 RepID=A0AA37LMD6_9PEZI|nr:hypothetical protein ColLi_00817 [Colletotrichum liriopes]